MSRGAKRRSLLFAVLGLAATVLAVDQLGPRPKSAAAKASPTAPAAAAPLAWRDVGPAIRHWTQDGFVSIGPELASGGRDLFVPTDVFAVFAAPEAAPQAEPERRRTLAEREAEFRTRHALTGVLLGQTPAALVDGTLVHVNSDVDGYRLVEIHRDYVVFQSCEDGHRVRMDVDTRPITPRPRDSELWGGRARGDHPSG